MEERLVDWVYDSLMGVLNEENCMPEVENAFEEGKPCQKLYTEVYEAYGKICKKYDVMYDEDAENIIYCWMEIAQILGYKMYEYGAKYGRKEQTPCG